MTEAVAAKVLMVGLPESGKSTYLAALFNTVRTPGSTSNPTSLTLEALPDERSYFHEIERVWLDLEPLERSMHSEPKETALHLLDGDCRIDIEIPDVSGETFDQLWETAAWTDAVRTFARTLDGMFLFVRSDAVRPPNLLEPPSQEEAGPVGALTAAERETSISEEELRERRSKSAEMAPTQTKLVDLLETLWTECGRVPVAVVISAWDVVAEMRLAPEQWLELNLPLLWQMLVSNGDDHDWRAFGVSAQGGDLRDPATRLALAKVEPPNDRIIVQADARSSDITLPLRWLLNSGP